MINKQKIFKVPDVSKNINSSILWIIILALLDSFRVVLCLLPALLVYTVDVNAKSGDSYLVPSIVQEHSTIKLIIVKKDYIYPARMRKG